jgi:hypothetical protein
VALHLEREVGGCIDFGAPVRTDAEGRFAFTHLPEGIFRLSAEGEEWTVVSSFPWLETGTTDARVWILGTAEVASHHFEVVLVEDATGRTRVDAAGVMIDFVAASGDGPRFRWAVSRLPGEPGRFVSHMPLPSGRFDVTLSVHGWSPARLSVQIPRVGAPPTVRLSRGVRAEGRVADAEGRAVAGARVVVGSQGATTGADGAYAMQGLESGETDARLSGPFVQEERRSVRVPTEGVLRLDWTAKTASALRVTLGEVSRETGVERVRATPLAGGAPLEESNDGPLTSDGQDHGTRFEGLAPGRWKVEAWQGEKAWPAQEVEVKAGVEATVTFR